MYLGIDVGGTKTLIAAFDERGKITFEKTFHTPQSYSAFLDQLSFEVSPLEVDKFKSVCVGLPASVIDRDNSEAKIFTNLAWHNIKIAHDLRRIFPCPIYFENDAKLAGYYEAIELGKKYDRVLYVTISTGIGYSLIVKEEINTEIGDPGGSDIYIERDGKLITWENATSGKAIVEKYGKKAEDINDEATWQLISKDINKGLLELIAILEPDAVVFGGSVGEYFHKYSEYLRSDLNRYKLPSLKLPDLIKAKEAEKAVVFGCYYYCKRNPNG